jgi:murein DD-endopeptidase MepM/ murein hydrolase activator NlpD
VSIRPAVAAAIVSIALLSSCTSDTATEQPTTAPASTTSTTAPTTTTGTPTTTTTTTTTTHALTDNERCLRRAEFDDPADSLYVLPYPIGEGYSIIQSYCNDDGSHEQQLAYDFAMPLGSTVVAARDGVVVEIKEDVPDDENSRFFNYVLIRHEDGTTAFYAHLQHEGALVDVGDEVRAGDPIALSGATGRTGGPVLHFGVYFSYPPVEGRDEPVVFNNTDGPLDARGGLREGSFYEALE